MKKKDEMELEQDRTTAEEILLLEQMPKNRLSALLHHPAFAEDVIKCAGVSETLLKRVDDILSEDVSRMATRPRQDFLRMVDTLSAESASTEGVPSRFTPISAGGRSLSPEAPLRMAAHRVVEPSWPFRARFEVEGAERPVQLKFELVARSLVVEWENLKQQGKLLVYVGSQEKAFHLVPGTKVALGPQSLFNLVSKSTLDAVVEALRLARISVMME